MHRCRPTQLAHRRQIISSRSTLNIHHLPTLLTKRRRPTKLVLLVHLFYKPIATRPTVRTVLDIQRIAHLGSRDRGSRLIRQVSAQPRKRTRQTLQTHPAQRSRTNGRQTRSRRCLCLVSVPRQSSTHAARREGKRVGAGGIEAFPKVSRTCDGWSTVAKDAGAPHCVCVTGGHGSSILVDLGSRRERSIG